MPSALDDLKNEVSKYQSNIFDDIKKILYGAKPSEHYKIQDPDLSVSTIDNLKSKGIYVRMVIPQNKALQEEADHKLYIYDVPMSDGMKLIITSNPKDKSKAEVIKHFDDNKIEDYIKRYVEDSTDDWDEWTAQESSTEDLDVDDIANASTRVRDHIWFTASVNDKTNRLNLKTIKCSNISNDTASIVDTVLTDPQFVDTFNPDCGYEISACPQEYTISVDTCDADYCKNVNLDDTIDSLLTYVISVKVRGLRYFSYLQYLGLVYSDSSKESVDETLNKISSVDYLTKSAQDTCIRMLAKHGFEYPASTIDAGIQEDIAANAITTNTDKQVDVSYIHENVIKLLANLEETFTTLRCNFDPADQVLIDQLISEIRYSYC